MTTVPIPTVTGDVPAAEIGLADGHGHAWIDPPAEAPERIELNAEDEVIGELSEFGEAGGTLLVDCQPGGCGRDARRLRSISRASGIAITTTTGFHLSKYYPADAWIWQASLEEAAAYFKREVVEGVAEAEVRAATLKVGFDGAIESQAAVLMQAAASVARETGAPLLFHTEKGRQVEALLPFFAQHGVPPSRLYLCHVDKRPDPSLHMELAAEGVLLGYDTFVRPKYEPRDGAWKLLDELVGAGLGHRVAVGLDLASPSLWSHGGGEGPARGFERIVTQMHERGYEPSSVRDLCGGNIVRHLTTRD